MSWLAGQTKWWLILAALLGAAITWLLMLRKVRVTEQVSREREREFSGGDADGVSGSGVSGSGVSGGVAAGGAAVGAGAVGGLAGSRRRTEPTEWDSDADVNTPDATDMDGADTDLGDAGGVHGSGVSGGVAAGGAAVGAGAVGGLAASRRTTEPTDWDSDADVNTTDEADTSAAETSWGADDASTGAAAGAGAGAGAVAASSMGSHRADAPSTPAAPTHAADATSATPAQGAHGVGSADPTEDGSSPHPDYKIKGNADSMKYHPEDSPYYGRTRAETWFDNEDSARTAGFKHWSEKDETGNDTPAALAMPAQGAHGPGSADPTEDGSSPHPDYKIKGNADSMKYHPEDSPYYGRTRAETWFDNEDSARAAGFKHWHDD